MMATDVENSEEVVLHGYCAPKYERLRDAFLRNFREFGELGASYAVTVGGELVIDLWGGSKDLARTQAWSADTLACVWSASKGVTGVCFATLVDRGLASYDDKVSRYWPEFAVEGKGDVTIGMLLSHQAGITGFDDVATYEELFAGDAAAQKLAAQKPLWKPGESAGYSNVIAIMASALFQRIEGRSLKRFVAEELKRSLGLDVTVGLDPADAYRAAVMVGPPGMDPLTTVPSANAAQRGLHNPPMTVDLPNTPAFRGADFAAANCFASARGLAEMYSLLLHPGAGGRRLAGPQTVRDASRVWYDGIDAVRGIRRTWAAGFLANEEGAWGPNKAAFGHGGWGGAFGFADPTADVTAAYVMNWMSDQMDLNPRRVGLIEAIYAA
jgi:CubicO group peptidase (beta-lactamase class C family)